MMFIERRESYQQQAKKYSSPYQFNQKHHYFYNQHQQIARKYASVGDRKVAGGKMSIGRGPKTI
ncbi:MAG: hypothetical protein ACK5L5_06430 [Bacteroidales bacterium]